MGKEIIKVYTKHDVVPNTIRTMCERALTTDDYFEQDMFFVVDYQFSHEVAGLEGVRFVHYAK